MSVLDVYDKAIAQAKERVLDNLRHARKSCRAGLRHRLAIVGALDLWRTLRRARAEAIKREVGF